MAERLTPLRVRRWRFASILNNFRQFAFADHRAPANFGSLEPALTEPGVNRPLTDASESLGCFCYRE